MFDPKQLEVMDQMGAAPPLVIPSAVPVGFVPCACGKKFIPFEEVVYHKTGVCVASDSLCRECQSMVKTHAVVVCVICKAVVARLAPYRYPSGFQIESAHCYHTDACPTCKPDIQVSSLIEKKIFEGRKL